MLRIEHFTKSYGNNIAVNDLSLHIEPGEICGFIGHNGAGKTTTIKACCGILNFDSGNIYINGTSILEDPVACKKQFAYIPDNPDIYEFMSGIKYLNFIGDIYSVEKREREDLIHKYSDLFGISDNLGQPINEYSHGMKQKLVIIAALIHSPKLLILDEPFVGLDPVATHSLKEIMGDICDKGGSIFFSTHVLDVAEKLCHRVAIIRKGELIRNGTMDEVKGDSSLEDVFLELQGEQHA